MIYSTEFLEHELTRNVVNHWYRKHITKQNKETNKILDFTALGIKGGKMKKYLGSRGCKQYSCFCDSKGIPDHKFVEKGTITRKFHLSVMPIFTVASFNNMDR